MADAQEIERVVRQVLAPLITADGGRLYLVEAGPGLIALHVAGQYSGCPGNTLAQRRFIEPALRKVAPEARVTVTSGALVPRGAIEL